MVGKWSAVGKTQWIHSCYFKIEENEDLIKRFVFVKYFLFSNDCSTLSELDFDHRGILAVSSSQTFQTYFRHFCWLRVNYLSYNFRSNRSLDSIEQQSPLEAFSKLYHCNHKHIDVEVSFFKVCLSNEV